jgi:hypothetical protein
MNKKIIIYSLLCLILLLLSACSEENNNSMDEVINNEIDYSFKEPINFPFTVTDIDTTIDIGPIDYLHQFVFHYRNDESTQQINYILSKIITEPKDNEVSIDEKTEYKLENGLSVYYEEDSTSQSLWWENDDGFLARFVYYINRHQSELGKYKLEVKELLELANQVQ